MAKKKQRKFSFRGIASLIAIIGLAGAAVFVAAQLSTRSSVSPNAPESKPAAAGDSCGTGWVCKSYAGGTACLSAGGDIAECTKATGGSGNCCTPKPTLTPIPTSKPTPLCTPGTKRCSGDNLKTCNSTGTAWTTKTCSYGCSNGKCNLSMVCVPGRKSCNNGDLYICKTNGSGIELKEKCSYGCYSGTSTIMPRCKYCLPGTRECYTSKLGNDSVLSCNTNGEWQVVEHCDVICAEGQCQTGRGGG